MKQDLIVKIKKDLRQVADKDTAKISAGFIKTGRGEYGEGDKFLGVTSAQTKEVATRYPDADLSNLKNLLTSPFHEDRTVALRILVAQYVRVKKSENKKTQKVFFNFYLKNLSRINNWDLVDLSAPNIVGDYLFTLSKVEGLNYYREILLKLAKSKNLWSRRVAVLATYPFIKNKQFAEILELSEFLLFKQKETHDLMHKAIGWMLREVGKREVKVLENFLNKYASRLPRTTLRYAIEKFPEPKRQKYLVWGKKQKTP